MQIDLPLALLGGLSPSQFMRRYWQKKPFLVRQAVTFDKPPVSPNELFRLAARQEVQSRLVQQTGKGWQLKPGPFARRSLPAMNTPHWTLLVQGLDVHHPAAHALLQAFRFVPDARLDDLMASYASDGGGVGPHVDSYDVFLLQVHGQRRWRIGRQKDMSLQDGLPLKILANFEPTHEYLLEPGDMLYLPPNYAHDGVAVGECMTYSIGFRAPARGELASELLQRLADDAPDEVGLALYRDPQQAAVANPGELTPQLLAFAQQAVTDALKNPHNLARALGEYLSEPKPQVWFEAQAEPASPVAALKLAAATRMLYDAQHIFINGEGFVASGRDMRLMRVLADQRQLSGAQRQTLSEGASELLETWLQDGWLQVAT
jgi:50S ribosomal protein L16 3-hydroxylase